MTNDQTNAVIGLLLFIVVFLGGLSLAFSVTTAAIRFWRFLRTPRHGGFDKT